MWGKLPPDPQAPATRYFFGHTTIPVWNSRIQLYMDDADTVLDLGLGDSHNRHKDIMSLTAETWYHVALTWDGGNYAVYVNGEEKANGSYIGLDALNTVADIGNDGNTDGRTEAFNGLLDDVRIYDRALSADEISQLAAAPDVGPVAHWKLDDGAGTIAVDSSGNGNDGVLMGDPQWAAGIIGGALDFDGDGDYVDCGYDPLFDITGEITVAAWLNIRSIPTAWTAAVAKGENAWRLSNVNVDPRFHFGITWWDNPDLASVDGATAVGFDEWHHATGTFDGANINVYLDGVLDGSALTTEPLGISTTNLFIGLNPESPGTFWDGLIDDVKIFDRALSADEILELAGEPEAAPAGFSDDFNRPDGDVGNGWETQTDGTITVQIVDNEVLIAGTQATDWARCGISRPVGDESMVSCDFMMPGGFNFHIRVDDADTDAYFEVYTWGGNLDHANSEDGGWPGWVAIPNASPIADVYNNIMLELIGNEITVTLNDTVVGTFTNANLTNIESVLICSDSAADTTGSLIIDNVVFSGP